MDTLAIHALQRAHLGPHLIYRTARDRDDPLEPAQAVASHVAPVRGHDDGGSGVTIHEPAPWRCPCGAEIGMDYEAASEEWAAHAAAVTGLPPEVLLAHMLVGVAGRRSDARCSCDASFRPPETDPTNAELAVEAWAAHVAEIAG